jgi:hypothetical protein
MVFVLEGDGATLRPIPVRVGVTNGSHTELLEGNLAAGTALVTDMNDGSAPKAAAPAAVPGLGAMGPGGGQGRGGGRR